MVLVTGAMKILSADPKIQLHSDFLSPEEISEIIALGAEDERDSTVVNGKSGEVGVSTYRVCKVTYLDHHKHPTAMRIMERLAKAADLRPEQVEGLQVLRYTIGGHYFPHVDPFDVRNPTLKPILQRGGQRIVSALIGLKPADEGGETDFNRLKLSVPLKPGECLLFWGLHPDGTINMQTEHSAMQVLKGEKIILVSWMRERAFDGSEEVPEELSEKELFDKLVKAKRDREKECFKAIQSALAHFKCTLENDSKPMIETSTGEIHIQKEIRVVSR